MRGLYKYFLAALSVISLFVFLSSAAIPAGYAGTPYPKGSGPREIGGRIDFDDYDCGGINVAFYADDRAGEGSWGGTQRKDDGASSWPAFYLTNTPWDRDTFYAEGVSYPNGVYYPDPTDTSIHNLYIGASHGNSWTKWTVHVSNAGKYWISSVFSAADQPPHFQISFLNGTKTTTVASGDLRGVPSYHSWKKFSDFASITLDTGVQVLYFQNQTGHLNQDFLYFATDSGQFQFPFAHTSVHPAVKTDKSGSLDFSISQNAVRFTLHEAGLTKISVFNCLGREIGIVLNKNLGPGNHTADLAKVNLKQGVYFLHFTHNAKNAVVRFQTIGK